MSWYKELARDYQAIGSWIFYVIVLARSLIEPYWQFATPLLAAATILLATELTNKTAADYYSARAITLAYFSSQFYQDIHFSIFAWILVAGVPISAYYTNKTPKEITKGILLAIAAIFFAQLTTQLIL